MDTRLILRTATEFAEFLALADHPDRFDRLQKDPGFDYVVLPGGYPDRYLNLIAHLYSSPDWKLVFTDGAETLLARRLPGRTDLPDLQAAATSKNLLAAHRQH